MTLDVHEDHRINMVLLDEMVQKACVHANLIAGRDMTVSMISSRHQSLLSQEVGDNCIWGDPDAENFQPQYRIIGKSNPSIASLRKYFQPCI